MRKLLFNFRNPKQIASLGSSYRNMICSWKRPVSNSNSLLIAIVYFSVFLDNVLLTVVVPLVPEFLTRQSQELKSFNQSLISSNNNILEGENGRAGILLASKALVQLVVNPAVGVLTRKVGYSLPLLVGSASLIYASIAFALAESFGWLMLARSFQGLASSCIGVSGMALVAARFPDEHDRSRMMGLVLGAVASGVLVGYPSGGFLYDFAGKAAPFTLVAVFACINTVFQILYLDLKPNKELPPKSVDCGHLLREGPIITAACAIFLSTSAMAILEPCLPLWLLQRLQPSRWQLGLVFIPDSLGYFIGAHCFGLTAYRLGRCRIACFAMVLVGTAAFMLPYVASMTALAIPHACLGLGIGIIDAALVPHLASLVERRFHAEYGSVYALQQTSVSLAYAIGPLLGGELVRSIGFPWVMRGIGLLNLIFSPLIVLIGTRTESEELEEQHNVNVIPLSEYHSINNVESVINVHQNSNKGYRRFSN